MNSTPIERTKVTFTRLAATFGGAQSVSYTKRFAWVKLANGTKVRIPRSKLPPVDHWSAFNLANAAKKELEMPPPTLDERRANIIKDKAFLAADVNDELLAACHAGLNWLERLYELGTNISIGDAGDEEETLTKLRTAIGNAEKARAK